MNTRSFFYKYYIKDFLDLVKRKILFFLKLKKRVYFKIVDVSLSDLHGPYRNYISDWRKSELDTVYKNKIVGQQYSYIKKRECLKRLKKLHKEILKNISYRKDIDSKHKMVDYWETSDEVESEKATDCEGFAVYHMRKMREAGLSDYKIGCCVIEGHIFATFHFSNEDFYVLDNGYISTRILKASEIYPFEKHEYICGFNLFKQWNFKKI